VNVVLVALVIVGHAAPAQAPKPNARARFLTGGPLYVGQPAELEVVVAAGRDRPKVTPPQPDDATILLTGTAFRPIAASGIGSAVAETNQYGFRFRLVPRAAGTLVLPPFTVESGRRETSTNPLRREVRPVPVAGRPTTFLGGVGAITASAETSPEVVRVGQPFELRLRLDGPGSIASTGPIDLKRLAATAIRPEVERLADDVTLDPPSRVRRFRLRPTVAGNVNVPPFVISWFDPRSARFQTTSTAPVPVRVADVPRLDPSRIVYGEPARPGGRGWIPGLAIAALAAVVVGVLVVWLRRPARPVDPRRLAARLASRFEPGSTDNDPSGAACRIMDALVEFLQVASGRPPGALTPAEARVAFGPGGPDSAERAAVLVAACDRARFSGRDEPSGALLPVAREFFEGLQRRSWNGSP
jgi:hypothetical protein